MKSLNDLHRIEPELLQAIQEKVSQTVASGWFVLGKNVFHLSQWLGRGSKDDPMGFIV